VTAGDVLLPVRRGTSLARNRRRQQREVRQISEHDEREQAASAARLSLQQMMPYTSSTMNAANGAAS
jgi:hypothetical protein